MVNKEVVKVVSRDLNIPEEVVRDAYNLFWKFVKVTIKDFPLKEDISEKEFKSLRTSFNIPSLGKLGCNYKRFKGIKKKYDKS